MRTALLALVPLLLAPLAGAVGPADADGGTPGDAGDVASMAKPIAPGTHAGKLLPGADEFDWYAFPAAKGQLIRIVARSTIWDGSVHAVLHGPATGTPMMPVQGLLSYASAGDSQELHFIAYETGTWALRLNPALTPAKPIPYRFELAVTTPAAGGVLVTQDAWAVLEARLGAGNVHYQLRMEYGTDTDHAYAGQLAKEANGGWTTSFGVVGWATGRTVRTSLAATEVPDLLPATGGAEAISWSAAWPAAFSGTLRLTAWNTLPTVRLLLAYAHTGPALAQAGTTGDTGLVLWEEASAGTGTSTPVYNDVPARSRTLDTASRFLGSFNLGDDAGHAIDPTGARHDVQPLCRCLSSHPHAPWMPGTWTFHVGPSTTIGSPGQHPYLVGVHVPKLGVY